jgi:hypothetical protein
MYRSDNPNGLGRRIHHIGPAASVDVRVYEPRDDQVGAVARLLGLQLYPAYGAVFNTYETEGRILVR